MKDVKDLNAHFFIQRVPVYYKIPKCGFCSQLMKDVKDLNAHIVIQRVLDV